MHKEQLLEVAKLSDCNIGTSGSLETFDTADTDTHMGSLDHGNIVGTVTDGQQQRLAVMLDQLDNQSFLERRNTTKVG